MWKKLSSKHLFNNPRVLVEEDEVELPSGEKINYTRFGYIGNGVIIICKNSEGEILLQREYSYIPNKKILQFPMGLIEKDENTKEAAKRELKEETGFKTLEIKLLGQFYQTHRRSSNIAYVFLAEDLELSDSKPDKEEEIETVWLAKEKITQAIVNGEIIDSDTLSALQILSVY